MQTRASSPISVSPSSPDTLPAYLRSVDDVARSLKVVVSRGLSAAEVARRQQQYGPNVLPDTTTKPWWALFMSRFTDPLVILLLLAAGLSLLFREFIDAGIIGVAIVLDAGLSFSQVWRSERTLRKLRQQVEQTVTVLRQGTSRRLPASYLVPGDIIIFRAGEKIPADARVCTIKGLAVAEGPLTGESRDVTKSTARLKSRTTLASRHNMVYLGTTVTNGSGIAMVTATGTRSEFGRIAQMLKSQVSPPSPLRKKLQHNGVVIAWIIIGLVVLTAVLGLLQGNSLSQTLRTAITLIVSAIPEDLTVILTIALTVGMVRILRHHGVVRELSSAETLGGATVICTDKTGTLTRGQMSAEYFDTLEGVQVSIKQPPREPLHATALQALALANDAHRLNADSSEYFGSATERTALAFVEKLGFVQNELRQQWQLRDEITFNPQWKYRASVYAHPTQHHQVLFVVGAPEILLERSSESLRPEGHLDSLSDPRRAQLQAKLHALASQGARLLGVAVQRHYPRTDITHRDIQDLSFLGVLVITDPVRPEARAAIAQTQSAGVAVKLVTGDLETTARAIAGEVGLTVTADAVRTGDELQEMSDQELSAALKRTVVFARVTPLDKQRIIRLLQEQQHVVAMTGDGVNDAVALKSADIGVAMGSGKDIAKDAADLVLLDDNFATIVHAIREGRVIRDNVRKVIAFLLATNVAEVAIFLVSVLLGWPLPLLPAQVLWINLVTDGTSDIALSLEPDERNTMQRPPEHPHTPLISRNILWQIIISGFVITTAAMLLYWYVWYHLALDLAYAQTMVFTFVAVSSLLSTWSFRSLSETVYRRGLWQNPWIIVSGGFSLLLQLAAIYVPTLQRVFGTVPLDGYDWVLLLAGAALTVVLIDLRKLLPLPANNAKHTLPRRRAKDKAASAFSAA